MKPPCFFTSIWIFLLAAGVASAAPVPQQSVATEQEPAPRVVRVGAQAQALKLVHTVQPEYPPDAKKAGIQGTVALKAVIGKDGSVEELRVVSGPCRLARSALEAVYRWKYEQTLVYGKPVGVETVIRVIYTLGGPGKAAVQSPKGALPPPSVPPWSGQKKEVCGGSGFQTARLIHRVPAVYPPDAMKAGIEGTVVLKALIGKDGRVKRLTYVSGPRRLVRAAMDAERQSQYKPAWLNGRPVTVEKTVTVRFRLLSA